MVSISSSAEVGRLLAASLAAYAGRDVVALALPGGAMDVASETVKALGVPLDVIVVRRLIPPGTGVAVGAIAGRTTIVNEGLIGRLRLDQSAIAALAAVERWESQRQETAFRGGRAALPLRGKTVLLIDDGRADPSDLAAALQAARRERPARLVMAFPASSDFSRDLFAAMADEIVTAETAADETDPGASRPAPQAELPRRYAKVG